MWSLFSNLYRTVLLPRHRYTDIYDQIRARSTLIICTFFAALTAFVFLLTLVTPLSDITQQTRQVAGPIFLILLPMIILVHRGQLYIAVWSTVLIMLFISVASLLGGPSTPFTIVLPLTMIYVGMVGGWKGALAVLLFEAVILLGTFILQANGQLAPLDLTHPSDLIPVITIALAILSAVAFLVVAFSSEVQRAVGYANRALLRLHGISDVAEAIAHIVDLKDLLERTVNQTRDRFGFYHVQIFLIDDEHRYANLAASTGEAGKILLQRGYRLAVGSASPIGQVTITGEPIIVATKRDLDEHDTRHANELLPDTRAELALPLVIGSQVIGVLDVQSTRPDTFVREDLDSLRLLATQVGLAINSVKLYEEQQQAVNDARRTVLEAQISLRESQRLNRQLTGKSWEEYLGSSHLGGLGYTLSGNRVYPDYSWTPGLETAATKRGAVIDSTADRQIVSVPVELRGYIIGAMEVELHAGVNQADTLEMLQSVAQRLALSVDNARLFEETQQLAQQELQVNSISGKLQSLNDIEDVLRTTLHELSQALGADQAAIRLGVAAPAPDQSTRLESGNGKESKGITP